MRSVYAKILIAGRLALAASLAFAQKPGGRPESGPPGMTPGTIQAAGLNAFSKQDVQEALKLTNKQKTDVKEILRELQQDVRDLMQNVRDDGDKTAAAQTKVEGLRKDAMDEILSGLSDEQKKTWKNLMGETSGIAANRGPGGFGSPGGPGGFQPTQPGQVLPTFLQERLKLTAEQKKEVDDLQKDVDAALDKMLTDEQKKRIKEMRGNPNGDPRPGPNRDRERPPSDRDG